jgi:cytochrome c-type biogenesis protein CcmH
MSRPCFLVRVLAGAALVGAQWCSAERVSAMRPGEMLSNVKLETRARAIDRELRCLVCQNESIDDSDADLAHDLRVLVRQRLLEGDSDAQVKAYVVARYGNYVLLKPPFIVETYLLWLGPLVLLVSAAGMAVIFYRRPALPGASWPLTADEERRVANLVGDGETGAKGA